MVTDIPFLPEAAVEEQASQVLQAYEMFQLPVNPLQLAKHLGIDVSYGDFGDDDTSGMLRVNNGQFEILVNGSHSPYRVRFTIAHELGHYVLHRQYREFFVDAESKLFRTHSYNSATPGDLRMEIQANLFAAALLMPQALVRQEFHKTRSVAALSSRFQVSHEAMGIRLDHLNLL